MTPAAWFALVAGGGILVSTFCALILDWPKRVKRLLIGLWIIIPPLWLWVEYCFLFPNGLTPFAGDFEAFKYGQELSKDLWLSISVVLTLLYFGKVPGL